MKAPNGETIRAEAPNLKMNMGAFSYFSSASVGRRLCCSARTEAMASSKTRQVRKLAFATLKRFHPAEGMAQDTRN